MLKNLHANLKEIISLTFMLDQPYNTIWFVSISI